MILFAKASPGTGDYGLDCTDLILSALNAGYRHIETTPSYRNAESVGAALKSGMGEQDQKSISLASVSPPNSPIYCHSANKLKMERMSLLGRSKVLVKCSYSRCTW
jgi:diketogulonate reductase-like aldo/keto reductase